jgi:inner membrane protein
MPTAITHSFIAVIIGKIFTLRGLQKNLTFKFWFFSIVCSVMPDIDVIPLGLGVPYEHIFGHRGFSHSILFVLLTSIVVVFIGFREIERYSKQWCFFLLYFFLLGLMHSLLDAFTSGGLGIGFFIPFDSTRYFFSFRPIRASPFNFLKFFSSQGIRILLSEFIWVWIPAIVSLIIIRFLYKLINRKGIIHRHQSGEGNIT